MKMTSQMYQSINKARYLQSQESILLVVTRKRKISIDILFSFVNAEQLTDSCRHAKVNPIFLFGQIQNLNIHSHIYGY